jgi:hypothetical protein
MNLARVLVLALTVLLPLTACLVFAAGEVLVPHPWSKHADGVSHTAVRLPSGVATTTTALLPLVPLGRLASSVSPVAASVTRKPPFVPPRA